MLDGGGGGAGARVLVVEDDDMVRDLMVSALESWGHEVHEAADGLAAFAAVAARQDGAEPFAAILSDLNMPGSLDGAPFDGLALLWAVHRRWPALPVALITGNGAPPRAADMPPGAGFLAKPYRLEALESLLAAALAG